MLTILAGERQQHRCARFVIIMFNNNVFVEILSMILNTNKFMLVIISNNIVVIMHTQEVQLPGIDVVCTKSREQGER